MMKTFVLVMFLAACSVHCNREEVFHSYLDVAVDMITKAKNCNPTSNDYTNNELQKVADCTDILDMGNIESGVYKIWPMNRILEGKSIYVYCDMDTDGGGWTVIQRRGDFKNPKEYFYRNWENYKEGFGNITQDFWLGNDKIFALTNQKQYSVRFDLKDVEQNKRYAVYDKFWIDDEERNYTLHIALCIGDAGDSMEYHNKKRFSTFDKGNVYCAKLDKGGWWYDYCKRSNLNGFYQKGNYSREGITWQSWKGDKESLEWTEIKIRPKYFKASFS